MGFTVFTLVTWATFVGSVVKIYVGVGAMGWNGVRVTVAFSGAQISMDSGFLFASGRPSINTQAIIIKPKMSRMHP